MTILGLSLLVTEGSEAYLFHHWIALALYALPVCYLSKGSSPLTTCKQRQYKEIFSERHKINLGIIRNRQYKDY